MAIHCESHDGKSTMLVGSMFHWYKAKRPKSTRISIWRQFSGLPSLPNFASVAMFLQNWQFFRKAEVSEFRANGNFLKKSPKNREIDNFWGPNFALRAIFEMADFGLVREYAYKQETGSWFLGLVIPSSFEQRKQKRKFFLENQTELCGFPWLTMLVSLWEILWVA